MRGNTLENQMNKLASRSWAILAVIAGLFFTTAALAQMPPSPWKKGAPFPEPDEELYGVALNGKLHVIGGWGERFATLPVGEAHPDGITVDRDGNVYERLGKGIRIRGPR